MLNQSEAKTQASPEPRAVELVYCIRHERMVELETCNGKEGHTFVNGGWDGEVDFCEFPDGYAFTAPPADLPDGWECQEPDDDQRAELELQEIGEWLEG